MGKFARAGLMTGVPLSTNGLCESPADSLNPAGLLILTVAVGSILTLVVWCYRSLLCSRDSDIHGGDRDAGGR